MTILQPLIDWFLRFLFKRGLTEIYFPFIQCHGVTIVDTDQKERRHLAMTEEGPSDHLASCFGRARCVCV